MATTFRFVASPEEGQMLLNWFAELPEPPHIHPRPDGAALFFRHLGPLVMTATNEVDVKRSPVVLLVLPQVRRRVLWTVAEVQFLAERMRSSLPGLQKVLTGFRQWARTFPLVFRQPRLPETSGGAWDYYLEGGVRNVSDEVFALPDGMAALERGQYFVWQGDSEGRLDTVLRMLRLRGVTNAEPCAAPNGGPATRLGNSGVTEGPPSVS
jgi:hypothetical protein